MRSRAVARWATLLTVALYAAIAFASPGFDDEIYNIDLVSGADGYRALATTANAGDIHPPGQYLIDKFLFDRLGDWSWVRVAGAVFTSLTLVALWRAVDARHGVQRAFAYLAICLNPAMLLWCTSLRWYAWFVPVLNLMMLALMRTPRRAAVFWGSLAAGSLVLIHIGYAALIVAPALYAAAIHQRRDALRRELPTAIAFAAGAALLATPQLMAFFEVHLPNGWRSLDAIRSIGGLALALTSNQGAMPFSWAGLALGAANVMLFALAALHWRAIWRTPTVLAFALSAAGIVATGLSAEIRNLVALGALPGLFQTACFGQAANRPLRATVLALFALGTAASAADVVRHEGTIKGSWNTPYRQVIKTYRERTAACRSTTAVTHDPVLRFHLRRLATDVLDADAADWRKRLHDARTDCIAVFETYRGSFTRAARLDFRAAIRSLPNRLSIDRIGRDDDAVFKRRFDPDVPDFYVTMSVFRR